MINKETIPNICAEIYDYLNILGKEYIESLPKELYDNIEKNRDLKYISTYDENIGLTQNTYSEDAINIIMMLDLKYWCTIIEKIRKNKLYQQNEEKYQKDFKKRYNQQDIFKMPNKKDVQYDKSNTDIVDYKESWLKKIFKKIKETFNKTI